MRRTPILALTLLALTGCASSAQSSSTQATTPPSAVVKSSGGTSSGAAPDAASMVCGPQIQDSLQRHLQLGSKPRGTSTWDGKQFVCTFRLADGPLVLTVLAHQSPTAATQSLAQQRSSIAGSRPITGLAAFGLPAAQADPGIVLFARDAFTLRVDSTGMDDPIGPFKRSRVEFAYSIAADVIACWKEHH